MKIHPSRRQFIAGAGLLALPAPVLAKSGDSARVAGLSIDGVAQPLALDNPAPQFSWRMEGARPGLAQSAYRILVASKPELLSPGQADLWDSGQVQSAENLACTYQGSKFSAASRIYWQVQLWDEQGALLPTMQDHFDTGLLTADDWQAQWLVAETAAMSADREVGLAYVAAPQIGAYLFRRHVTLDAPAKLSVIFIASGTARVWLDGAEQTLPPFSRVAFGSRPADQFSFDLAAGNHDLVWALQSVKPAYPGVPETPARIAAFFKLRPTIGAIRRDNSQVLEVALGSADDFIGKKITAAAWQPAPLTGTDANGWPPQQSVQLRHEFTLTKPVARAVLYATALGAYEPYLNDAQVGDAHLAPEVSDFRHRVTYQGYDVTAALRQGANAIGALVGDGWYASYMAPAGRFPLGPPPRRLLMQLMIEHTDGSRSVIATNPDWRVITGPVLVSEIYNGEAYDARLEIPGWATPGFNAVQWEAASLGEAPPIAVTAQNSPQIRAIQQLRSVAIHQPSPGVFVFDFGQNFAGWVRLRALGTAGQTIILRHAEVLKHDGNIDQSNLRAAKATDHYTLKGDPTGENWHPRFTYHGFRYVEVTGYPGMPSADDVIGVSAHNDLTLTGDFASDNRILNGLWHNALWSQRSNFFGLPTDCPQRDERLGWMGDANVFWPAASFNMDVQAFTRRFVQTIRDLQAADGGYTVVSPDSTGGAFGGAGGAAPGWADAGVTLPYTNWRQYNDTGLIDQHWDSMQRYLNMVQRLNPDLIWRHGRSADFGDWLSLDGKSPGDPTTPKDLLSTAVWSHSIACVIAMGQATGRHEAVARWQKIADRQKRAFCQEFVRADGSIGIDSQTGYILPLAYDMLPAELRPLAVRKLADNIIRRGRLLSTGFLGTPPSLDVLADHGQTTLAYDLLLRTAYPSWGYMVVHGATTMWERWNGDTGNVAMNSFNHYALGAVASFLYRRIAGIAPLAPGFRQFEVAPILDARVKWARARYLSAMGPIEVSWRLQDGGGLTLDLSVPPNSRAELRVPVAAGLQAKLNGRNMPLADGRFHASLSAGQHRLLLEDATHPA